MSRTDTGRTEAATEAPTDLHREVSHAIKWVALEKWLSRGLSLGVFAVLTRFVPVEDFGLIAMATVVVSLITVFVDSGFSKSLIQRGTLGRDDASTAFWTSLGIAVVLAALMVLTAPLIASLFGDERLGPVLMALSAALPLAALSGVPAALLEREIQFRALAVRQLIGAVVGAMVAIPLAVLGFGVWALVAQTLATLLAAVIVLWTATGWRPGFRYSRAALREMTAFASSFLGIEVLNSVQMNIDKLLIGAFLGPVQLGYYFVGQRALNILTELISSILGRVSLTTFSRIQHDPARVERVLRKFVFASGAVAVPVFGICALLAPQIIPFLFGAGWVPAILVFQLLAPSAALNSITSLDKNVLLAARHNRAAVALGITQTVVGTVLLLVALPFGMLFAAASRSISAILMLPVRLWILQAKIGIRAWRYLGRVSVCVLALLPSAALVIVLQQTGWATVGHVFFAFAVPVAALAFLLYCATLLLICGRESRAFLLSSAATLLKRTRPAAA